MSDWTLDHLVIATSDLQGDIGDFERNLKCKPTIGGKHPSLGTQNALVGVSESKTYIEIIGPDPSHPNLIGSELLNRHKPGLRLTPYHYAIRTSNLEGVRSKAKSLGLEPKEVEEMSRKCNDGTTLKWKWLFIKGHGLGGLIPFFVDWGGSKHPSANLTSGKSSNVCLSAKVVVEGPTKHLNTVKKLVQGVEGVEFIENQTCGLSFPIGISGLEGGLINMAGFQPEGIDFEESKTRQFEWTAFD